ncbi:MAG: AI-2E family transporter [Deltaproteobacteria bacterium]|nr:AI-2E family transporter [Nannocystaceae bacterium]
MLSAFALLFWLLFRAGHGVMILVAGIVIAVLIDAAVRRIPLPRKLALVLFLLAVLLAFAGLSWWTGAAFADQLEGVRERALEGWPRVQAWMNERSWGRRILEETAQLKWSAQAGGRVGDMAFAAIGGIATLLLVPIFGVFFALSPKQYIDPLMHLLPESRRARVREVVVATGHALRSWFVGRFVSMTVVGLGTGLGLWAAGVPMPAGLGVIAGLLSFVPNVGPLLAAIPGVLVGLSESPSTALWAVAVYVGIQGIDNYLVSPFVDQRSVDVPPATQLGAQLLLGFAAGGIGVFLATPLMIIIIVAVQALYVQDVLHDRVRLLGEHGEPPK